MNKVRYFQENTEGRDFVVGDIHGAYDMVLDALKKVGFRPACDRLFCVGDLVDRGSGSLRVLRFLEQPYVFSGLGNHEAMFLEIYEDGIPDERVLRALTSRNGMGWWMDISRAERMRLIEAFRKLPLVIEIESKRGTIGLLHAEVPIGMSWSRFKENIEQGDAKTVKSALWGRTRAHNQDESGVEGVGRVFSGHTPQWDGLRRLGNVYMLDTGAAFFELGEKEGGRLTVANAMTHTGDLIEQRPHDPVDVRVGRIPTGPFGTSLVSLN